MFSLHSSSFIRHHSCIYFKWGFLTVDLTVQAVEGFKAPYRKTGRLRGLSNTLQVINHGGPTSTSSRQDQSNKCLGGHFCACSFLWKVVISYHCSKQFKLVKQQTRICILVPREKLVPLCILPKLKVVSASVHKQYLFDFHKSRTVFFHCSVKLRVWALIRTWVFLHILNGTGGTSYTNLVPCRLQSPCASCTTEPKGDYRTSTL